MEILGYAAAVLIGISLGLIGGGGSILTVPVLVYLMHVDPLLASTYSLFIVGTSSAVGGFQNYSRSLVDFKVVSVFGISSIISVLVVRKLLLPFIPNIIFTSSHYTLHKPDLLMIAFAALMVAAAFSMIKNRNDINDDLPHEYRLSSLLIQGVGVGVVTGLLGAGGGFLIIPALVLFAKLPMKKAVGTSLVIIALNSLIGFFATQHTEAIDWKLLLAFTSIAVTGIFIGNALSEKIPAQKLKKGFGWFVLIMGVCILIAEIFFKNNFV